MSESNGIVWEAPPPKGKSPGRPRRYTEFFGALRKAPGQWALFPTTYPSRSGAQYRLKAVYGPGFEFTSRLQGDGSIKLYVRYVGEAS